MKRRMFRVIDCEIVRGKKKIYNRAIVCATSETEALKKFHEVCTAFGHLEVRETSCDVYTYGG